LEARRPDATPSHLAYIEVGKRFRWGDENAYEETGIYGIGEPDDGTTHYGIELIPLNNLIHLPVRLRPQMQIFKDYQKLAEAPCTFTLLEILGGIYWEITSHGSPEERDKLRAELLESDRADNYQQTMNDET